MSTLAIWRQKGPRFLFSLDTGSTLTPFSRPYWCFLMVPSPRLKSHVHCWSVDSIELQQRMSNGDLSTSNCSRTKHQGNNVTLGHGEYKEVFTFRLETRLEPQTSSCWNGLYWLFVSLYVQRWATWRENKMAIWIFSQWNNAFAIRHKFACNHFTFSIFWYDFVQKRKLTGKWSCKFIPLFNSHTLLGAGNVFVTKHSSSFVNCL